MKLIRRFKNFLKVEWSKLRVMTFAQKREYIWEYYKFHFVMVILIVGVIAGLWQRPERDYLYIAWLAPDHELQLLMETGENLSVIVDNPSREVVTVVSYTRTDNPMLDSSTQQRFVAMMQIGGIDIFVTPRRGILELAEDGLLMPMAQVMEQLAEVNPAAYHIATDYLLTVTYTFQDEPENTDVLAISVASTPFFEYLNADTDDLYFAIPFNTRNLSRIARALEVIFLWGE